MESRAISGGGPAAAGGFEYQKLVTAWAAAHMIADAPVANRFELPSAAFSLLRAETEQPVDDVMVVTATGGIIVAQVKRSVDAGTTPRSQLAGALEQVVRQVIKSRLGPAVAHPDRPWDRALDHNRDRIAIISRALSGKLEAATRVLRQLRAAPTTPLEDLGTSEEEKSAIRLLGGHVARIWREETATTEVADADIRACLLPLIFVALEVETGGRDETAAKIALQQVLRDAAQIDACWSELAILAGTLITRRAGVERSAVLNHVEQRGIKVGTAAGYRADIEKLRAYGVRAEKNLEAFAGLQVRELVVRIPRAVVDELVEAVSKERSLLITGDPGAGKSGAVHDLAERLTAAGHDVVVLTVDRIAAGSMGQLRKELGLEHELVDVLANWLGDAPAYLIIDALDAARAREAAQLVRDLLRQVIESRTRWRVVASMREFDLKNSPQLQAMFAGTPPARKPAPTFARLRHVHVWPLDDEELQYLWSHAPEFAVVFEHSDERTRDLLRMPFNLRLFADLFTAGIGADELTAIRTRTELLEGYWKWRVLGEADPEGDAREDVLRNIAAAMIAHRSLRAVRADLPGTIDSAALTHLYSNGVLAPWTAEGATEPERAVITFSHHMLFDYAVARLLLRGTPETLVERLAGDPEFILSFRPSAVMHFEYLWLREKTRTAFWPSAIAVSAAESLPAIAKTIAPAVAVSAAHSLEDFDGLLHLLSAAAPGVEQTARHVFGALLAAERSVQPLVGTSTGLWAALLRATATHLTNITAYAIRPTLYEATEQIDAASEDERKDLWTAAAALLRFARSRDPFDEWLAVQAVRVLCRTYAVDPDATRDLLGPILDPEYFARKGIEELYWIAREIERIISVDPGFVRRVYEVAFSYRVLDDRQVSLGGGALLNLTTSAKQHHESILHSLGKSFDDFLAGAPDTAIQAVPALLETRRETRGSSWVSDEVEHFTFLGTEVALREDGSYIWDGRSSVGDDYSPILRALEDYFAALEPDAAGIAYLKLFGATNMAAAGWRQLLRAGAKSPERLGRAVVDLASAEPLLYAHDTTTEAGRFIAAIYPLVPLEDQERIERAILHGAADAEAGRMREHLRDRLLGSIPAREPVTAEARSRVAELLHAGGAPENDELFEITGGAADYTDEDYLSELQVPVKNTETQELLTLTRTIEKFTRESLNTVPDSAAVEAILPRLHDLHTALRTLPLHDEARDYGWGHLAEAAERIARVPSFDAAPFAEWIVETLRQGTRQRQPLPQPDSAFKTPGWGSPSARLDAAEGWMRIGRYARFVDAAYLDTVRALARDGAPSVRFHVARDLRGLYRTAPDVLWELVAHFGENENSLGVLQGFLDTVQALAPHHPDRTVPVVLRLLDRVPDDKDERAVRDAAVHVIAGLYLWQGNDTCAKVVSDVTADLQHRTDDASRIAGSCEYALEGDPEAPKEVVAAARGRAVATLGEMLMAAHAAMEQQGLHEDVLREVASFATHVGLGVYRIVGVDEDAAAPAADLRERYARIEPLLSRLATFGVPMLAHYLLGVLETAAPIDPVAIFRLVGQVVESARRYGYEYESEAVRLIVRFLKRYMAEYPEVVRSPEGQKIFLRTLDIFVQVGWPDARRLSYHLEEAFR